MKEKLDDMEILCIKGFDAGEEKIKGSGDCLTC